MRIVSLDLSVQDLYATGSSLRGTAGPRISLESTDEDFDGDERDRKIHATRTD